MILSELLDQWTDLGIILWEDDGRLRYRAPRGVVTSGVISQLRANKEDILARLRERSGPRAQPEDRFESFPLTDVQGAYLMGRSSVFDYGGVACHLYCEMNYPRLDPDRATAAWRALVDRHDMLRVEIDVSGFQRVRREVPLLEIPVTTLVSSAPKEREMQLEQVRERLSHSVHPTGSWPMFAIEFTQPPADEPDGQSTMHISFDFLVGDWASLLRLIREWEQEYAGREAPVGSPLQFRDYVLWETAQREGQSHRRARDYWLNRIDDLPPAPQLPVLDGALDPAAASSPVRWCGHSFLLPHAQWQQLERHAREYELTASVAVLACYADVLSRWAEDPHFCLNLTVLDRPSDVPELARVVGDFTSVTLLETRADTRPFTVRAREMLEQLFTDLDHRSFSGVEVMREIARRRSRDVAVMPYVYTSAIGVGADDQDVASTVHGSMGYTISQTPQAFLDCQVMDDVDGLHVHWDAREGIFPAGMLDDMFTAFTDALRRLAADGGSWSTASPVELPAEQRAERERANATQRDLPTGLLHEFVIETARTSPAAMAVLGRGVNISYTELLRRSATIATALEEAGVRRGDRVAIAMPKSPDQVAAVLGVLFSGAAYVPLDIRHPRARLSAICDDAGVVALVCAGGHDVAEGVPSVNVGELPVAGAGTVLPAIRPDADPGDLAYVIYTSGSTGRPKGVEISHRAAVNTIMDVNERFKLTGDDRTLAIADLGFDLSVYDIFGPLSVGGAVVLPPADTIVTPSTWLDVAAEHDVTTMNTVPAVAQLLLTALDNGGTRLSALRQWILSGDRIPPDLVRDLQKAFPHTQFVSMGGATEAAIWSIAHPIAPVQPSTISIPYGLPLANQRFAVLDTLGRDAPTGVPGELVIMGTGLADGYSNAPELTARSFVEDPSHGRMYRTGDLGFYRPGGEIEILGRLDDQIKIRGHRIELGEVESVLVEHEAVAQAAVVAIGHGAQRRLHAFVVPADVSMDDPLRQWVQEATAEASAQVDIGDRDGIAEYAAALETACVATMMRTLEQIDDGLPVAPANEWMVDAWRQALRDQEGTSHDGVELQQLWARVEQLSPRGFNYRQFTGYVKRSAELLPELFSGRIPAHELLFPDGSQEIAERVYRDRANMQWGNAAIAALVSRIAAQHRAEPLRILEIGAGTGSTTGSMVAGLSGKEFHYTFTDRSAYFLPSARERWGSEGHWRFETFDIDRSPTEQGFAERSYDLVCAFGVLENARNIPQSLERLAGLVVDGGLVMLSEPVDEQWWVYLTQIFLMTKPDESHQKLGLFPSRRWWLSQLAGSTGGGVVAFPAEDSALAPERFVCFVSRVCAGDTASPHENLTSFLSSRLPGVMVPQQFEFVPELPLTRNGKIDKKKLTTRAEAVTGEETTGRGERDTADPAESKLPERTDALAARIADLWAEQLGLGEPPAYGVNPFDLGANSISAAAVAGRLRDEVPEFAEASFETVLRVLLSAPSIGMAAVKYDDWARGRAPGQPGRSVVEITSLRDSEENRATASRATVLFSDSLANSMTMTRMAAALPPEAGTIVAVTIPDDEWFTNRPADTVTNAIADLVATAAEDMKAEEYSLIGYSYGALVAIETARRLLEAGRNVLPLGLIDPQIVPVLADDRLSEVMFLTSRGASLDSVVPRGEKAPELIEIFNWILARAKSGSFSMQRVPDLTPRTTGAEADTETPVGRFFAHLASLDEQERWRMYQNAMPAEQHELPERLRQEWLRYRHTMRAATLAPEPLVADAVILQPRSSHGFLPGAHERSAQLWQDVFIGTSTITHVNGNHFTMLDGGHVVDTAGVLIGELAALGVFPLR
jgi:amino acid adenylation domain